MKKIKIIILFFVALFITIPNVNAANITSSAQTVYPGQSFNVSVSLFAASWNVHTSTSGPVSGCIMNDANASDTAMNVNKVVSATCTATGVGTITVSLYGDYTTEDGNNIGLSGSTTIQVVQQPQPQPQPQQPSRPPTQSTPQPQKSSNNYLKSLKVDGCSIEPNFDKNILEYSCKDLMVDKITINAEVEDTKSTLSGIGTKELFNGDNNFEVSVTSENGQVRVYKLLINKKNIPSTKILNVSLGNTEYKLDDELILFGIPSGTTSLDLKVKTDSITAKVNIIGNENLKPGNNIIKISVTDTDCKEKVYKVLVYIQENEILEDQNIQSIEKDYTVNLRKNSAYVLSKNILSKIGTNKVKYNIIDQNYGLLSSMEINTKKELEKDYELYFMVNEDKIYTNIFKDTVIKTYFGNKFKLNEKLYIYEYNSETRKYTKIDEQEYNDYYISFKTTDSFEYLVTNKLITETVVEEKKTSLTEIIVVILFQVVIMTTIIVLFTNVYKNKYKKLCEEKIGGEAVVSEQPEAPVIVNSEVVEPKQETVSKEQNETSNVGQTETTTKTNEVI